MSALIHKVLHPFLSPSRIPDTIIPQTTSTPATKPTTGPTQLPPVTVIELFQSQGCNSCPPANASIIALAARNDPSPLPLLLLTYEVTYWDHLGWTDTLGDRRWDARQRAYARALRQPSCYTPQVLVDGGARPVGKGWRDLAAVLAAGGGEGTAATRLAFEVVEGGKGVRVAGGEGKAFVFVVYYEPEPGPVHILRGENRGETERYRNVVRDLKLLGTWEGQELVVDLPEKRSGLEMALLVQSGNGGQILGAVRV